MKSRGGFGCIVAVLCFVALIIWIRYDDARDEAHSEKALKMRERTLSEKDSSRKIALLQELHDFDGGNDVILDIMDIYETQGAWNEALEYLDKIEVNDVNTDAVNIRKAIIKINLGDTITAKTLLEKVLSKRVEYKPLGFWGRWWNRFINSDRREELNRCNDFLDAYNARLMAIGVLLSLSNTVENAYVAVSRLNELSGNIDLVVEDYERLMAENPKLKLSDFVHSQVLLLNYRIRSGDNKMFMPDYSITAYRQRWFLGTTGLLLANRLHGATAADKWIEDFLSHGSGYKIFTEPLIVKCYRQMRNGKGDLPMQIDSALFAELPVIGQRTLVFIEPTTAGGEPSALIRHGITTDRVLLGCNDWSYMDSVYVTAAYFQQNEGYKRMTMLSPELKVDSVCIKDKKIGALVMPVLTHSAVTYIINKYLTDHDLGGVCGGDNPQPAL